MERALRNADVSIRRNSQKYMRALTAALLVAQSTLFAQIIQMYIPRALLAIVLFSVCNVMVEDWLDEIARLYSTRSYNEWLRILPFVLGMFISFAILNLDDAVQSSALVRSSGVTMMLVVGVVIFSIREIGRRFARNT